MDIGSLHGVATIDNIMMHMGMQRDFKAQGSLVHTCQDRLNRDQPESRPESQFTLRQHLTPEKITNWDYPSSAQE